MIDEVTREIYACHQDKIIAIKEQGYLQKEMAEEKYLESQPRERETHSTRREEQQDKTLAVETISEIPPAAKQGSENVTSERDSEQRIHKEISD